MLHDLFKKFANEVVELHFETVDLASDSQLSAEVVPPGWCSIKGIKEKYQDRKGSTMNDDFLCISVTVGHF